MQQLPSPQGSGHFLPAHATRNGKGALPATFTEVSMGQRPDLGNEAEPGSLLAYGRILARRKGMLTLIVLTGTLIGYGITVPQTPVYQARTSLEVLGLNQNFMNVKETSPVNEGGSASDTVDIQTQVKILQSDSLLDRVIEAVRNSPVPEPAPLPLYWHKLLNIQMPAGAPGREAALLYARKNLKVRSVGQTRIVEVTVDSLSPEIAAAFANTMANEFIDQNIESRWKTTERTGKWLTRQLEDMRVRLQKSEDNLHAYARQAGLMFTEQKTNVSEDKLRQIQEALSAAQTDRITKESRKEIASTSAPEALPDVLNDPILRDYQGKITELNRELAELRTTYTPEHAKVKRVEAQLAALQTALDRARNNILSRIRNDYEEALRRERMITANYAAQRVVVTGENDRSIQYNILKQEAESNRQLYDSMLQQMKQSSLASALRASNIRVVDQAKQPQRPYRPDVPISSGVGLLSGLFLGAAFLITQDRANRSIQGPGETPLFLMVPELGIVPADTEGTRLRLRHKKSGRPQVTRISEPAESSVTIVRRPVELVTWHRKTSIVAESFRAALVSILFSGADQKRPRVMVVTSGSPSEGKSTTVSNLGIAISEVNHRVLLIDADMRRPRLHHIFKLNNDKGLSDLLVSEQPSSVLRTEGFIQNTGLPNLHVMTSGPTASGATSLLYSPRTVDLLNQLREEYEIILIDTPPMLQIPDARVMGRLVDGVILVVRAGKTTREAAFASRQRFAEDGTEILGTILNQWNPKSSPNGYYGYSNGYYRNYKSYANQG
jgi:succinoglycan biosynthesis transport protein ExoP